MKSIVFGLLAAFTAVAHAQDFVVTDSGGDSVLEIGNADNLLRTFNGTHLETIVDTLREHERLIASQQAELAVVKDALRSCGCGCTSQTPSQTSETDYDDFLYLAYQSAYPPVMFVNSNKILWTPNYIQQGGFIMEFGESWDAGAPDFSPYYLRATHYITGRGRIVFVNSSSSSRASSGIALFDVTDEPGNVVVDNFQYAQFSDGWSGDVQRTSNTDTDYFIQTSSTEIRRYSVPESGPMLTFVETITLGAENVLPYSEQTRIGQFAHNGCTFLIPNDSSFACATTSAYQEFNAYTGELLKSGNVPEAQSVFTFNYHWGKDVSSLGAFCKGRYTVTDVPSATVTSSPGGNVDDSFLFNFHGNDILLY